MVQLVRTHTALATPLTLMGKISDMTSQGIGPQPRAKPETVTVFLATTRAAVCFLFGLVNSFGPLEGDQLDHINRKVCQVLYAVQGSHL